MMINDALCIKEDVCEMAVCDGIASCSHAVLKTAVLAQQTNNSQSASALEICVDFMREYGLGVSPSMFADLKQRLNGEAPLRT